MVWKMRNLVSVNYLIYLPKFRGGWWLLVLYFYLHQIIFAGSVCRVYTLSWKGNYVE